MTKTMICLILDRSGSMSGKENDVIGGVNTFITQQKQLPDPAQLCLVRFDTSGIERFRPMTPLEKVEPLLSAEYVPSGGTPLLDAIGDTINQLDQDWTALQPQQAILMIVTDGQENSSTRFKKQRIKEMIEARQASGKWAFIYLGADLSTFDDAQAFGILQQNTAMYTNTPQGTKSMYATASQSVGNMRMTGSTNANLGAHIDQLNPGSAPVPNVVISAPNTTTIPPTNVQPVPGFTITPTNPAPVWIPPASNQQSTSPIPQKVWTAPPPNTSTNTSSTP